MAIALFTDFGHADPYVGQVKAVLARVAPGEPVFDLFNDAPDFNIPAAAHLLAALVRSLPQGTVLVAVVDPGVGGLRSPVVVRADGCCLVGPDNGLLSVVAGRAAHVEAWKITWTPEALSASFHGRDLFAPIAGQIALGSLPAGHLSPIRRLKVRLDPGDLAEVIHVDHYGNAMTGLRASTLPRAARISVKASVLQRARVFSDVGREQLFWYENSLGLVEIAANCASAAALLGIGTGSPVRPVVRRAARARAPARSKRP